MSRRVYKLSVSMDNLIINHPLVRSMVSYTIKDGKKSLAVRLVNKSFNDFFKEINVSSISERENILNKMVETIRIKIAFFKRRIGSRTFQVPYVLTDDRSYKHSVKRFYNLIRKNQKRDYSSVLLKELLHLYNLSNRSLMIREKNRIYHEGKVNRALFQVISKFKLKDPERLRVDLKVIEPIVCKDD